MARVLLLLCCVVAVAALSVQKPVSPVAFHAAAAAGAGAPAGAPGGPGAPAAPAKHPLDVAEQGKESNGAPEQGFAGLRGSGAITQHDDKTTMTSDWRQEFGPHGPSDLATICSQHPENRWCSHHAGAIAGNPVAAVGGA